MRDLVRKRQIYGKFGVSEYWVVDGTLTEVEIYRLKHGSQEIVNRASIGDSIERR